MPHHKRPDEGGLDFGTLEFDDETGTEISVGIKGKTTAGVDLAEGATTLAGGNAVWTPATNTPGPVNWQDVGSVTVELDDGTGAETVELTATSAQPVTSATIIIKTPGLNNCSIELKDQQGAALATEGGTFPSKLPFETMEFDNQAGRDFWVNLVGKTTDGPANLPQGAAHFTQGANTWSPATNAAGQLDWHNVNQVGIVFYGDAEYTQHLGVIDALEILEPWYGSASGSITNAPGNNCHLIGKDGGGDAEPGFGGSASIHW